MRRLLLLALAGLVVLAACTGGGGAEDGGSAGDGGNVDEPIGQGAVEAAIELTAPPEEGAGEVPTFEWEPVGGAAGYRLVVLDAEGRAVWAWEGPDTSVALGGVPDRPEGSEGPVLTPGSTWSVAALDAEGHVLATSELRPASP
ncbi:MAG: hypothetical protein ACRDHV_06465 [Actinomycetota bacterium]